MNLMLKVEGRDPVGITVQGLFNRLPFDAIDDTYYAIAHRGSAKVTLRNGEPAFAYVEDAPELPFPETLPPRGDGAPPRFVVRGTILVEIDAVLICPGADIDDTRDTIHRVFSREAIAPDDFSVRIDNRLLADLQQRLPHTPLPSNVVDFDIVEIRRLDETATLAIEGA